MHILIIKINAEAWAYAKSKSDDKATQQILFDAYTAGYWRCHTDPIK